MIQADVSVVVPTFRDTNALSRALRSIEAQTLPPAQVVVVDDGGGDPRLTEVCEACSIKVDVVRLAKNVGPGGARNAGVDASKHAFIAFLDADDEWHPEKLARQMAVILEGSDVALCCHGKAFEGQTWAQLPDRSGASPISRWKILSRNLAPISSVIVKRSMLKHRFPVTFAGEDYSFVLENMFSGLRSLVMDDILVRADKPAFGTSGLSRRLLAMQVGEMRAHARLLRMGLISLPEYCVLVPWTLVKYVRRLAIVFGRNGRIRSPL
jgi:glycosyltransferase involved in cell wall biosynthesis